MRGATCLATTLLLGFAMACAKPAASRPSVKLVVPIVVTPADAEIWVDGRFVATVAEAAGGLRLPVGRHELEIVREGYFPYLAVIDVAAAVVPPPIEATLFPVVREVSPP